MNTDREIILIVGVWSIMCVCARVCVRARAGVFQIGNNNTRYEHAQYTKEHTTCIFVKCWVTTE